MKINITNEQGEKCYYDMAAVEHILEKSDKWVFHLAANFKFTLPKTDQVKALVDAWFNHKENI